MSSLLSRITELENLRRAFRRVESAQTPSGVDGVTLIDWYRRLDENLEELRAEWTHGTYRPLPLLAVLAAQEDGPPAPLFIPTVRDRTAQAAVVNVIDPILEAFYPDDPFPHRKTGCVRHAAQRVRELWERGYMFLVHADVASLFESVDHEAILKRLRDCLGDPLLVDRMAGWLKADVYDGEHLFRLERGIARGTVLAPTLAKLCLDWLAESLGHRGQQLVRYADNLVVLARSQETAVHGKAITPEVLAGLTLSMDPEDPKIPELWRELELQGFLFAGDGMLTPFDRWPRSRTLLFTPPPFDLAAYLGARK